VTKRIKVSIVGAAAVWSACLLSGCQPLTGTETGNGTSGLVVGLLGRPVCGAQVTLVRADYNELEPSSAVDPVCSTRTDAVGRYRFSGLRAGRYNLFCDSGPNSAYRDSLEATGIPGDTIATVYLRPGGGVTGTALVSSGRSASSAAVTIVGSVKSAPVRADDGGFLFSGLAPGTYRAKIVAGGENFFSREIALTVREGRSDTIRNPFLLISTAVTALAADSAGMWIGTVNGLAHLARNGTWRVYGLPDGLSSSRINGLLSGPDGSLWAGTTLRLARVRNDSLSENIFSSGMSPMTNITALAGDVKGDVWVGTPQGLFMYARGGVVRINWNDALTGLGSSSTQNKLTAVSAILCLDDEVVVGTLHGVYFRDSGAVWREIAGMANLAVSAIARAGKSIVWFGTNQGMRRMDLDTRAVTAPFDDQSMGAVTSLAAAGNDSLYIGTADGLFAVADSLLVAKKPGGNGVSVTALATDATGALWAGTNEGIVRIGRDGIQEFR
jgi:ligand-binding sensor domain-containing protein